MPTVQFTAHLRQQIPPEPLRVEGGNVLEALSEVFAKYPQVKSSVLDDQGAVRKHVAIFLDGQSITDRRRLSDPVHSESEIFIMQALSGG
jgi:sulfur-carrier protein